MKVLVIKKDKEEIYRKLKKIADKKGVDVNEKV